MKKYLILAIFLCCVSQVSAGVLPVVGGGVPAAGGYATPAYVNSADVYGGGFANDATITGVTNGNFLVMVVTGINPQTVTGVSTSSGSTSAWTKVGEVGAEGAEIEIYWACATATGDVSAKPSGTSNDAGYAMLEYSGVLCTDPVDGTLQTDDGVDSSDTSIDTAAVSVSQSHNLLIGAWASESADRTITYGDGWTQRINRTSHIHKVADKIVTSTGDYDLTGTLNSGLKFWVAGMIVFKAKTN